MANEFGGQFEHMFVLAIQRNQLERKFDDKQRISRFRVTQRRGKKKKKITTTEYICMKKKEKPNKTYCVEMHFGINEDITVLFLFELMMMMI